MGLWPLVHISFLERVFAWHGFPDRFLVVLCSGSVFAALHVMRVGGLVVVAVLVCSAGMVWLWLVCWLSSVNAV